MSDRVEISIAVRVLDSDHQAPSGGLILDVQERAAPALDLQRPLEETGWRIVEETNDDTARLVFHLGGMPSERAVALELHGPFGGAQAAGRVVNRRAGFPRPDDRRARVLVNAVRLADLDLLEAGVL